MSKKHMIIGVSAAGIGVLSKLRTLDPTSTITCIAAQQEPPYNTCLLADVLAGIKPASAIMTKSQHFFDEHNITLKLGTTVIAIDPISHTIETADQKKIAYDTLFLGLGTSARVPSIPGASNPGVFGFHTLEDTHALDEFIKKNNPQHAVIIGAGLSGIECADALVNRGIAVDIIEMQDHILPTLVDSAGAQVIRHQMSHDRTHVHVNARVEKIATHAGTLCGVYLTDGIYIACDMVVFATGARPNNTLAESIGIKVINNRIVTNEYMETNIPGIFAGGDLCMVRDLASGNLVPSTLWTDAMIQGMHAAHAMAGVPKAYPGALIITSSRFFGITFAHCGNALNPGPEDDIIINEHEHYYHKFIVRNGYLTGFLMVGNIKALGVLRNLILNRQTVTRDSLLE